MYNITARSIVSLPGTCVITDRSQRSMFLLREWSFYPTCWQLLWWHFEVQYICLSFHYSHHCVLCLIPKNKLRINPLFWTFTSLIGSGRDVLVYKVCQIYDNEDWLGCKRCGQFFHTSCLGVNFAMTLQDPFFYCPWSYTRNTHKWQPTWESSFRFLKYVMELWLSLLKFTFEERKSWESAFSKVSYII